MNISDQVLDNMIASSQSMIHDYLEFKNREKNNNHKHQTKSFKWESEINSVVAI